MSKSETVPPERGGVADQPLLDLPLALYVQRRLNADATSDFLGRNWPITPTVRQSVTIAHHPGQRFWAIPQPPHPNHPVWPEALAHHRL